MTKLYKGTIEIDGDKMDEAVNQFLIENGMKFNKFLELMGENGVALSNPTYYSWIRRGRMKSEFVAKMRNMGIDTDLFIK